MATRRSRAKMRSAACSPRRSWRCRPSSPGTGPFPHGKGRWTAAPETLTPGERNAAASLYLALMTAKSLTLIGAGGRPSSRARSRGTRSIASALAAITGRPVEPSDAGTGTMLGALMTATGTLPKRARRDPARRSARRIRRSAAILISGMERHAAIDRLRPIGSRKEYTRAETRWPPTQHQTADGF